MRSPALLNAGARYWANHLLLLQDLCNRDGKE
jgi:hypothetical protein